MTWQTKERDGCKDCEDKDNRIAELESRVRELEDCNKDLAEGSDNLHKHITDIEAENAQLQARVEVANVFVGKMHAVSTYKSMKKVLKGMCYRLTSEERHAMKTLFEFLDNWLPQQHCENCGVNGQIDCDTCDDDFCNWQPREREE